MTAQEIANKLDTIYKGEPWFGESLQTKLKNVSEENAFKQPVNNRHSIAEILSHMEYWHKRFVVEVQGKTPSEFSESENWPDVTTLKNKAGKNYKHCLMKRTKNWLVFSKNQMAKKSVKS